MKKVVLLAVIFLPVLIFVSSLNGNLFEHTEEIGNTAINSITNMFEWLNEKGDAISDFVNSDAFSNIVADVFHSPYKSVEDYSAEDIYNAVAWEIKNGTMNFWQSAWFQIKWDFLRASYSTIDEVYDWDPNNPYIYPPE